MVRALTELRERLAEVHDLERSLGVLGWDQRTMMPAGGGESRSQQLATLGRIAHDRFTSDDIGRLLDKLRPHEESLDPDSDDASLVRVTRRDWEKERRVPSDLTAELLREGSRGHAAWQRARDENDFSIFLPSLRKVTELSLRWAECFEPGDEPYDVFLDDYEPGMKTAEIRAVFDVLRPALTEIVKHAPEPADDSFLHGDFPIPAQQSFLAGLLPRFGLDDDTWRLDPTVHPFATSFGRTDIRLTTRFKPDNLRAIFAAMHEAGHGVTYQGIDPALERSPLYGNPSLGLGESQSRTWENLIGRSRGFWERFLPDLAGHFPQLEGVGVEEWYRAINRCEPTFVRVDADEVTYSLHIILRFELEQAIVSGSIDLADLPEAWNAKMRDFLGIEPPTALDGVLQDVHWSRGGYGYFPTYALGNVLSVQIWRVLEGDVDVDATLADGDLRPVYDWLAERIYRHGRKFTPLETLTKAIGSDTIDPQPYLEYLRAKVASVGP